MKLRRHTSVLGFSIEPEALRVCRMRRRGTQIEVAAHARIPIPASQFKTDPARAGQALRAGLQAARIRPERCVVCLPSNWVFTSQLDLPPLSEADLESLIRLEAERRFPLAPEDLSLNVSRGHNINGNGHASLVGLPNDLLSSLVTALKTARLRPASITIGTAILAEEQRGDCAALLCLGEGFVDLAVAGDGVLFTLRNLMWNSRSGDALLDAAQLAAATRSEIDEVTKVSPETACPEFDTTVREVSRQLRISLAQLPPERRSAITAVVAYASQDWPAEALSQLAEAVSEQGLSFEEGAIDGAPINTEVPPALLARATRDLLGSAPSIELISKKRAARLHSVTARFSKRSVRWAIGATAAVLVLLAASFGLQDRELAQLEDQWAEMAPHVDAAKGVQDLVRKYRPWYDESIPSLAIPKWLASAFPEEGSVSLKTLHVKDRETATCSGIASNFKDLMQVKEALDKSGQLDDLKLFSAQGRTPVAFTLTFRWKGKGSVSGQ